MAKSKHKKPQEEFAPVYNEDYANRHGGGKSLRKKIALKVTAIVLACILGVAALAYGAGVLLFSLCFTMPNSTLNGTDVSLMGKSEIETILNESSQNYSIHISGYGLSRTIEASEIDYEMDVSASFNSILTNQDVWTWPFVLQDEKDVSNSLTLTYSKRNVQDIISPLVTEHNKEAEAPQDAYISFDEISDTIAIEAEDYGTTIDVDALVANVKKAIETNATSYTLTHDDLVAPEVLSDDEKLVESFKQANEICKARITLTLNDVEVTKIGAEQYSEWLTIGDNSDVSLDTEKITAWAESLASDLTTYGTERTYTRPDGKEITIKGGVFGWKVDAEELETAVLDALDAGETTTLEVPHTGVADTYTGVGKPDWTAYIDIDITEQHARYYDETGKLVWESDIVTGIPDGEHDTPQGVYYVTGKQTDARLLGPEITTVDEDGNEVTEREWDTTVNYWIAFVGTLVGMHDALWRTSDGYGGTIYTWNGSHACVNVPLDKVKELYELVDKGVCVISHS